MVAAEDDEEEEDVEAEGAVRYGVVVAVAMDTTARLTEAGPAARLRREGGLGVLEARGTVLSSCAAAAAWYGSVVVLLVDLVVRLYEDAGNTAPIAPKP